MLTGLQTATRGGYSMYQIIMPQQAFKAEVIFFCKEKDWNPAYHNDTYSLLKIYKNIVSNPHLTTLSPP